MKNQYIYILVLLLLGFSSCEKFKTEIDENRESFIKIYPKGNSSYNGTHGNYIVNTDEGFLLGGSLFPEANTRLSRQIRVSHDGDVIEKKDISNSLVTYNKIIPSSDGENFYFLGTHSGTTNVELMKMSLTDSAPIEDFPFGSSIESIDFSVFSNNGQENVVALIRDYNDFPESKLILVLFDKNLNPIWEREFSLQETTITGFSVIHEASTGNFIILGRNSDYQLLFIEANDNGNLVNVRFFEEFGFAPIQPLAMIDPLPIYQPVLLDMETHYMVIETGRAYTKSDPSLPLSSIYRVDKDLNNIQLVPTDTDFSSISTVQNIDDEIIINGFIRDSIFAIKRLDNEGGFRNWTNSENEEFVTFDMNLKDLGNGEFFNNSPSINQYDDFFRPGNIVRTIDGGYAMIGTYGIFNDDDFEAVMTLFKFKGDGSY